MKNYIKLITATAFTVLLTNSVKAQSQISFFHLGDYVQQSTDVSPVYIPKNSFSFGLPGVSLSLSNGFSSSDLLTVVPGTENTTDQFGNDKEELEYNYKNVYDQIEGDHNDLDFVQSINILNLAFKRKHGSLSFFVNQKSNINWQMSKNGIVNILANGITDQVLFDDNMDITTYAEAGVGFTQQFLNDKLAVGVRVKYLIGAANGSTQENGTAQINVNDDLTWTINTNEAVARVAGVPLGDDEDYEFSTNNSGIGFDIGASYEIIPNLVIEAAVNDIGSITWKENIKEYYMENVTDLVIDGADLDAGGDVLEELVDELEENMELGEREGSSYKTSLATTSYLSASYKLANVHQFRATMFNNHTVEDSEAILALGYNLSLDRTTYGIVGIKNAYGEMDLGVNLATKIGPLQIYLATDNLNRILGPVEDLKQANIRFGLNFVFGYNKWL
ncbi:DUF5723 family protein [Wenyingzhuangia aestuarii]|uniref:DUF5723 family protein n=1 Tax=Wenyingzhuangia aestuarii TaxID=1647582 RepID=UPI00143B2A61|nr:DUF5723 family protein [Wenyingzhuangia aestuarii]NJB83806.1 hypothetical protein [Wenyingzhuangia aestuarii]